MNDRGTGRTTRMLMDAAAKKAETNRVLVVVHEPIMYSYCRMLCRKHEIALDDRDFATPAMAGMRMRGTLHRDQVFVDHAVWETLQTHYIVDLHEQLRKMP